MFRQNDDRVFLPRLWACIFLIIATFSAYWHIRNHDFINYDDFTYVVENEHVKSGLNWDNVVWSFTAARSNNWHPLSWISHMMDCHVYGLRPGGHHVTNLVFHVANAILIFLVFTRITAAFWESFFLAVLFALHPLHVESVAWIAERKDVLSLFFGMATIWTFIRWVDRPCLGTYILAFVAFTLSLLSKPMMVTLPFVLLLLDYWPLGRLRIPHFNGPRDFPWYLVWEKVPFFALSLGSSVVTFLVQQSHGAVKTLELFSLKARFANAMLSYIAYAKKMLWPSNLAVFYPHTENTFQIWQVLAAVILLGGICVTVVMVGRRRQYFVVGWFWYIGTLIPVIGFVQVGHQSMADRYTYMPILGLFIIITWSISDLTKKTTRYKNILISLSALAVIVLGLCSTLQTRHWRSTVTLFEHAIAVGANSYTARAILGKALAEQGKNLQAVEHFAEALQIKPYYAVAHYNLGVALAEIGQVDEAVENLINALKIRQDYAEAHNQLGILEARQGKMDRAIFHFSRAVEIQGDSTAFHKNLKRAMQQKIQREKF